MNGIEERGKRTALTEPSGGLKETSSSPINQWGNPRVFDTGLDPIEEAGVKSESMDDLKEKFIFNSVKGISLIKFDDHTFFPTQSAGVNSFSNQDDVIGNMPTFYKATLIFRNDTWKDLFETVNNDFSDDFVPYIA